MCDGLNIPWYICAGFVWLQFRLLLSLNRFYAIKITLCVSDFHRTIAPHLNNCSIRNRDQILASIDET